MRYLLLLIALLLPARAEAIMLVGFGEAPGGSCETQSADVSLTVNNATSTFYESNAERGQSWTAGVSGQLYSVTLYRNAAGGDDSGAASGLSIRIGESTDLSSTYLVAFTCTISSANPGAKECIIPEANRPTLASGTTYYLGMRIGGGYTAAWNIARDSGGSYAGGTSYYDTAENWVLTAATSDLYFIAKMCD